MGIVERLRERPVVKRDQYSEITYQRNPDGPEAADLIERLKGYAVHLPYCQSRIKGLHENPCTCGLTALIKEISNGDR